LSRKAAQDLRDHTGVSEQKDSLPSVFPRDAANCSQNPLSESSVRFATGPAELIIILRLVLVPQIRINRADLVDSESLN
jgi:hypothetical protein